MPTFHLSARSPLTLVYPFLTPISCRIGKDGLRCFVKRSSGSDLLRDIRRRKPPENSTSAIHRWRCLSVSYGIPTHLSTIQHPLSIRGLGVNYISSPSVWALTEVSCPLSPLLHFSCPPGILITSAFLWLHSSSDFLSNLLVLLLRIMNAGLSDSGLLTHLSEATAGSLSGVGHSSVYEDPGVFE
jgi:hypothetical protein